MHDRVPSFRIAESESRGCVAAVEDRTQFTMQVGSDDILFKALVHSRDAVCRMFELLDGEDGREPFTTSVERLQVQLVDLTVINAGW